MLEVAFWDLGDVLAPKNAYFKAFNLTTLFFGIVACGFEVFDVLEDYVVGVDNFGDFFRCPAVGDEI